MKRGPKPKPTKLKVLQGNPGKRPINLFEPEPEKMNSDEVPDPPKYLDRIAKKEWRRMAKELHGMGLLKESDITALGAYCVCFATWVTAIEQLRKHGVLIKAQSGFPMQSPYLQIANKAQSEMRKWLIEFGMTPSSLSSLKVQKPKPQSKADAFRNRKNGEK